MFRETGLLFFLNIFRAILGYSSPKLINHPPPRIKIASLENSRHTRPVLHTFVQITLVEQEAALPSHWHLGIQLQPLQGRIMTVSNTHSLWQVPSQLNGLIQQEPLGTLDLFWCSFVIFVHTGPAKYNLDKTSDCGRNEEEREQLEPHPGM